MMRASEKTVSVILSRVDTELQDFLLVDETTLVFQSGQTQVCVPIVVTNDVVVEGQETFMLEVSTFDPDVRIFRATTILNIADDDSKDIVITLLLNLFTSFFMQKQWLLQCLSK